MLRGIAWWTVGMLYLLFTLVALSANSAVSFLAFLIPTIISIPPIYNFVSKKFNLEIKTGVKIIILIVGFFIGGSYLPKIDVKKGQVVPTATTIPVTKQVNKISPLPSPVLHRIIRVVDGDTVVVNINNKDETIRLIGINSPEVRDPRKPVECFGKEASTKAKEILTGKNVRIENDPTQGDKDKYKRLLRYIFLEDGTNFNKLMIEEGYAFEYTYNIPYKYQEEFKEAQRLAEINKKGLWADGACNRLF